MRFWIVTVLKAVYGNCLRSVRQIGCPGYRLYRGRRQAGTADIKIFIIWLGLRLVVTITPWRPQVSPTYPALGYSASTGRLSTLAANTDTVQHGCLSGNGYHLKLGDGRQPTAISVGRL